MMEETVIARKSFFDVLELCCASLMLFLVFVFQMILYELPCTLCLLQRIGLMGVAFGFVMNLRFGPHPHHYVISLLSALFASLVALRQIALHEVFGTGPYGGIILGLHFYTWSFSVSIVTIIITALLLGVSKQMEPIEKPKTSRVHILFLMMVLLVIANIVSIFFECGLNLTCPDFSVLDYVWF